MPNLLAFQMKPKSYGPQYPDIGRSDLMHVAVVTCSHGDVTLLKPLKLIHLVIGWTALLFVAALYVGRGRNGIGKRRTALH